ncbi:hypothetical protein HPB49_009916 [Dermacentor silvarum]|uniref:Uncharacterized protein n=1 Tax=Dermacentor silvarum TaxID=543639 RepID=A0ACB8D486_DERSI|nr:hypothetical protein HPB49_009916 [Dermacentor silvarum]
MSARMLVAARVLILTAAFAALPARGANPLATAVLLVKAADVSAPEVHCAFYVPAIKDIAKNEEDAEYRPLINVLNDTECDYERRSFEGKMVLMERCDNTSNDDIIQKAKSAKAAAVLMTYNEKRPVKDTSTTIKKLDIIAAFVKNSTGRQIAQYEEKQANGTVMAKLFTRTTSLDWSFLVIWLIAVFTVMTGSYWSGINQYDQKASMSVGMPADQSDFTESMSEMEEEFTVPLSPKLVVMFVMHMSVMLLMLYYFYRYLVYFIVVLFALASAAALIACLEPVVSRINIGTSKYVVIFRIVTTVSSNSTQVPYSARQLNTIARGHNRESVMVEVAKGGNVMETLPMVIKFPRFMRGPYRKCFLLKYSILGLGDILAPGE